MFSYQHYIGSTSWTYGYWVAGGKRYGMHITQKGLDQICVTYENVTRRFLIGREDAAKHFFKELWIKSMKKIDENFQVRIIWL